MYNHKLTIFRRTLYSNSLPKMGWLVTCSFCTYLVWIGAKLIANRNKVMKIVTRVVIYMAFLYICYRFWLLIYHISS